MTTPKTPTTRTRPVDPSSRSRPVDPSSRPSIIESTRLCRFDSTCSRTDCIFKHTGQTISDPIVLTDVEPAFADEVSRDMREIDLFMFNQYVTKRTEGDVCIDDFFPEEFSDSDSYSDESEFDEDV
jgi:hypothetical protein